MRMTGLTRRQLAAAAFFLPISFSRKCFGQANGQISWTLHRVEERSATDTINWRAIIDADLILEGTLSLPANIREQLTEPNLKADKVVSLPLAVSHVYKGTLQGNALNLQYYPKLVTPGQPDVPALIAAAGIDGIFFLSVFESPGGGSLEYSFSPPSLILQVSPALREQLVETIVSLAELARHVKEYLRLHEPPLNARVTALVEELLRPETASGAIEQLLALDRSAIPALVRHLDDRRPLAIKAVSVRPRSPNAFEGRIHYAPQEVVDLLSFILSHKTDDGVGSTANGGSELNRQRILDGWRVWLGRALRLTK